MDPYDSPLRSPIVVPIGLNPKPSLTYIDLNLNSDLWSVVLVSPNRK